MITYIFVHMLCAIIMCLLIFNKQKTLSAGDILLVLLFAPIVVVAFLITELIEYLNSIIIIDRR